MFEGNEKAAMDLADKQRFSKHVREFTEDLPELKFSDEELALLDRTVEMRHRALDQKIRRELIEMMREQGEKIHGQ